LLLPGILAVMAVIALAPNLPQLSQAFAGEPGARWLIPMIVTVPSLCLVLFSPLAGMLGDRFGRRRLLLWAMVVYSVVGCAPMLLDSLWAILVSRVFVGITEAAVLTLSTTLIGDYFKGAERDRWLGYQTAVASISSVALFAIAGALGQFGWRAPFAIYALPLLFVLLVMLFTWEPAPQEAEEAGQAGDSAPVFPWKRMGGICAITLVGSIMFYVVAIQASVALANVGLTDPKVIGGLTALSALGTPLGTILFRFITTWPIQRLLLLSFALIGVGLAGIGLAPSPGPLTASLFVAQVGCGVLLPSLLTWAVRGLPYAIRGKGVGVWQGVFSVGQFISTLLVVALTGALGGLPPVFYLLAAVNLVMMVVAITIAPRIAAQN
jgi:MFS family permease